MFSSARKKNKSDERYELIEVIGEGGMGVVWRAFDRNTGGEVALKTLLDTFDKTAFKHFQEEIKKLVALPHHPNIIRIMDVGEMEHDGQRKPFFSMPLLTGATLAERMRASPDQLTVERVVDIASQTCRGLQVAHAHGLIHRDIKPWDLAFKGNQNSSYVVGQVWGRVAHGLGMTLSNVAIPGFGVAFHHDFQPWMRNHHGRNLRNFFGRIGTKTARLKFRWQYGDDHTTRRVTRCQQRTQCVQDFFPRLALHCWRWNRVCLTLGDFTSLRERVNCAVRDGLVSGTNRFRGRLAPDDTEWHNPNCSEGKNTMHHISLLLLRSTPAPV